MHQDEEEIPILRTAESKAIKLSKNILTLLGEDPSSKNKNDITIHEDFARRWRTYLQNRLCK